MNLPFLAATRVPLVLSRKVADKLMAADEAMFGRVSRAVSFAELALGLFHRSVWHSSAAVPVFEGILLAIRFDRSSERFYVDDFVDLGDGPSPSTRGGRRTRARTDTLRDLLLMAGQNSGEIDGSIAFRPTPVAADLGAEFRTASAVGTDEPTCDCIYNGISEIRRASSLGTDNLECCGRIKSARVWVCRSNVGTPESSLAYEPAPDSWTPHGCNLDPDLSALNGMYATIARLRLVGTLKASSAPRMFVFGEPAADPRIPGPPTQIASHAC